MTNAEARFNKSHIRKVYACLAVTCHLHLWQKDRDFLRATLFKKKLHAAFIDFKKAFDLISYPNLRPILLKHALSGKIYFAIHGMYRVVKDRVRCGNGAGFTDFFFCQKGLK